MRTPRLLLALCAVAACVGCGRDWDGFQVGDAGAAAGTGGGGASGGQGGAAGGECFPGSKACPGPTGALTCFASEDPKTGCNSASCSPCAIPNATAKCGASGCEIDVCDPGFEDCDGKVETGCETSSAFDPKNCGTCGNSCFAKGVGFVCQAGACVASACQPVTAADCDLDGTNGCEVDTLTDVNNCGFCTNKCSQQNSVPKCQSGAQGGECAVEACTGTHADCDKIAANGCEVDTSSNADNCGSCGNKCSSTNGVAGCVLGNCQVACFGGFADCNLVAADGCETNLNTSVTHCGKCASPCSPQNVTAPKCTNGACDYVACSPGYGDCDNNRANGCETNLNQDVNNCGVCATKCTSSSGTPVCNSGSCGTSCSSPSTLCQPPGVCANLASDLGNCGSCGNACPPVSNAAPVCISSSCGFACNSGFTKCGAACANTTNDVNNCGSCGNPCTAPTGGSPTCNASVCGFNCGGGLTKCGTQCKDLTTDLSNCGSCGNACVAPANGVATCAASSCGFTCNSGFTKCGASCVNTANDPLNCSSCGNACGANRICSASTCVCSPASPTLCGTACVNTQINNNHCGSCNDPCPITRDCINGICQ